MNKHKTAQNFCPHMMGNDKCKLKGQGLHCEYKAVEAANVYDCKYFLEKIVPNLSKEPNND